MAKQGRWLLVLGCFAVSACDASSVNSLFGPASSTSEESGQGGHVGDLPQPTGGEGGAMQQQQVPTEPSSTSTSTGSSTSTSTSTGSSTSTSTSVGSSTSTGGAQCLTCEVAVDMFREMRGAWEGFCTEPNNSLAWSFTYTCFCDPRYGGCADDCGTYCSGDRGEIPAGSACDACTRDHRGKCGAFLNNCSQASQLQP